jgi:hypothetical protein
MPFTADLLAEINASALKNYLKKGDVLSQNIQNKPLLTALNRRAGRFSGGNGLVTSRAVDAGQGGGSLAGYHGDDQVTFYNPTGTKRAEYTGKEHHIGIGYTMSELKEDGIIIEESGADQESVQISGREEHALVDILETKFRRLDEDFNTSLDLLLHGDGSADPKALAGIKALILDNPLAGTTGGLNRALFSWWRNRAATATYGGAGGQGPITVDATGGGALIAFLDTEIRQLKRYVQQSPRWMWFAGSSFIDGYKSELRANGYYSDSMSTDSSVPDGSMKDPRHAGNIIVYDPTLDDLGNEKRCYALALGEDDIQLKYLDGRKKQQHNPARPYDRYVVYNAITTTAVLTAHRLRTSAVYDIA